MKFQKKQKGFTLLEVVVSLALIVTVFGGVTSLAILTRESEQASKNNLVASYLAKEGQELVRYYRDQNYLRGATAFFEISDGADNTDYTFFIDYSGTVTHTTTTDVKEAELLKINTDNFYNNAGSGTDTIFRRLVTTTYHIATETTAAYIDVKVEVHWKSDTKQNTYTLNGTLSDWLSI